MKNKMILLNDALKIFYGKFPNFKVVTTMQYDQLFVFDTVTLNKEESDIVPSLISVDRISGEISGFNPLDCDLEKYLTALSEAVSI